MVLNLFIIWLFIYIWYDLVKNWNPMLWFLIIVVWGLWSIFSKYNSILLLFSSVYFFFDYTINYSTKKEEIQEKVNKRLKERNNDDIIKFLV